MLVPVLAYRRRYLLAARSRTRLAPSLGLSFVLSLAACGGDTSSTDGEPADSDTAPSGTPRAPDGMPASTSTPMNDGTGNGAPDVPAITDSPETPATPAGPVGTPERPPDTALTPLPAPPLTPAPDARDEPRPLTEPRSTASGFPVVENRPRSIEDTFSEFGEAEFAAGIGEPVLDAPPDHDPRRNRPPYIPDLDNVTVFAGSTLELHIAPLDPDGGVAGQWIEGSPPGSIYLDNLDTTRTFVWRPLEPDVGIRALTVHTADSEDPEVRVTYTVLIRVLMPADPSTIENRPPGIDLVEPQTVRVGDPVVIGIKGTDLNGTLTELEVLNPPPGATLVTHPEDPRIRVLRFVPDAPGTLDLDVVGRDARDPELFAEKTIRVTVRSPGHFAREGARLRELADARDFLIGFAAAPDFDTRPDGALYAAIAGEEFNIVSTENSMKWDTLNPLPGVYRWASADNLVAWAHSRDLIVHGHTLVWYTQLPAWVKRTEPAMREGHMREHIDRVLTRYADDVPLWDVVNESLEADGGYRDSIWLEGMGPDYIEIAFRQARASAPEATLIYNDYDIGWAGPKADGLLRLLERLQANGTPLDGVGFQLHVSDDFDRFDELAENFRRIALLDLDVYVTELDVTTSVEAENAQAEVYEGILSVCLEEPRCKALQSWGFTDRYSWRAEDTPLMFDRDYTPKPAYRALQRRLGEN